MDGTRETENHNFVPITSEYVVRFLLKHFIEIHGHSSDLLLPQNDVTNRPRVERKTTVVLYLLGAFFLVIQSVNFHGFDFNQIPFILLLVPAGFTLPT